MLIPTYPLFECLLGLLILAQDSTLNALSLAPTAAAAATVVGICKSIVRMHNEKII